MIIFCTMFVSLGRATETKQDRPSNEKFARTVQTAFATTADVTVLHFQNSQYESRFHHAVVKIEKDNWVARLIDDHFKPLAMKSFNGR